MCWKRLLRNENAGSPASNARNVDAAGFPPDIDNNFVNSFHFLFEKNYGLHELKKSDVYDLSHKLYINATMLFKRWTVD